MKQFIDLKDNGGEAIRLNPDHIVSYGEFDGTTKTQLSTGKDIYVMDTLSQVDSLLEQAGWK